MRIDELTHVDFGDQGKSSMDYRAVGVPPKYRDKFVQLMKANGGDVMEKDGAIMVHQDDMEVVNKVIDFLKQKG